MPLPLFGVVMGVRRQAYVFIIADNGSDSVADLEAFANKPKSIFTSNDVGSTKDKNYPRASTSINQFITVEAMGSTPGFRSPSATAWNPRGALNLLIENTYFYNQPDGTWSEGLTGTASPYPVSIQRQRSYNAFPRVYFDENTNYDVTYYMGNSIIGEPDNFVAVEYVATSIS